MGRADAELAGDIAHVLDTFRVLGEKNAVPSGIAAMLKSFGIVNDPAMTQRKVFNCREADELLKQINAHDDGGNASLGAIRSGEGHPANGKQGTKAGNQRPR